MQKLSVNATCGVRVVGENWSAMHDHFPKIEDHPPQFGRGVVVIFWRKKMVVKCYCDHGVTILTRCGGDSRWSDVCALLEVLCCVKMAEFCWRAEGFSIGRIGQLTVALHSRSCLPPPSRKCVACKRLLTIVCLGFFLSLIQRPTLIYGLGWRKFVISSRKDVTTLFCRIILWKRFWKDLSTVNRNGLPAI